MSNDAPIDLRPYLEHTLLRADATREQIEQLCREAREHEFYGVCVNSGRVGLAYALLESTLTKVVATVGFPLGAMDADVKRYEAEVAVDLGAHELDLVISVGELKENLHTKLVREIRDVVEAADERPVKVILETSLLTREEIILGCKIAEDGGADFVKTSTGFGTHGANIEDVKLMRATISKRMGVKASGGIRTRAMAIALVGAGATRLGTSSGIAVCTQPN